jgi:hypothetical protein
MRVLKKLFFRAQENRKPAVEASRLKRFRMIILQLVPFMTLFPTDYPRIHYLISDMVLW